MKKIEIDLSHEELVKIMMENNVVKSKTEWNRLLKQNAIHLVQITLKIGKKRFYRLNI